MRIDFEPLQSLPRLAWCVRLQRNADTVRVRHGSWVETRADCFFEGVVCQKSVG